MNLFIAIGDIYDIFIEEAETANIAEESVRRRKRRNTTAAALATASALGIAAFAVWRKKTKQKRLAS
ncbi:MAG: hypothetical protein FWC16_01655 [Defluviitaleaceae bacterium]|nr:hypothetical protein [Defluviitaleaceae bacterium]MCL2273607.1 hypothetical protein [Defluviitaleaceae bacterium]